MQHPARVDKAQMDDAQRRNVCFPNIEEQYVNATRRPPSFGWLMRRMISNRAESFVFRSGATPTSPEAAQTNTGAPLPVQSPPRHWISRRQFASLWPIVPRFPRPLEKAPSILSLRRHQPTIADTIKRKAVAIRFYAYTQSVPPHVLGHRPERERRRN